jgi:hypothetical protein
MNKLEDLSFGILVFLLIIVAIEFWIVSDQDLPQTVQRVELIHDSVVVTHKDLRQYISTLERDKATRTINESEVYKSIFNGVVRGFLMGLVLSDLEGGIVMAMMLGLINPVILYAEKNMF